MKIYRKEIANFLKGMSAELDDNALPMQIARRAYNYDFSRGALIDGYGVSPMRFGYDLPALPLAPEAVWQYNRASDAARADMLVAYCDGALYALSLYGEKKWGKLEGSAFSARPTALNYRLNSEDVLIVTSPADEMLVYNGVDAPYRVPRSPKIVSMCVHYERLWAVDAQQRDCVWFSSDLDPTAWDVSLRGAGFISMPDDRGQMLSVLSYLDYVYVFREYGITRVSAYADQTQFSVSHLFTSSGRIYGETVCLCGDRILFAASDGIYRFDGLETVKILTHLTPTLSARTAFAAFSEGKYYLACDYDFGDGTGSAPAILCYDIADGTCAFLRGAETVGLARVASGELHEVAVLLKDVRTVNRIDTSGSVLRRPTRKVWETPETDLGYPDRYKFLESLTVVTREPLTLFVSLDGARRRYELPGGTRPTRLHLTGRAKLLSFCFSCSSTGTYVSHPVLTFRM